MVAVLLRSFAPDSMASLARLTSTCGLPVAGIQIDQFAAIQIGQVLAVGRPGQSVRAGSPISGPAPKIASTVSGFWAAWALIGSCAATGKTWQWKGMTKGKITGRLHADKGISSGTEPGGYLDARWRRSGASRKSVNQARSTYCTERSAECMFRLCNGTTPEERRALGQARRKQVGRQQHDELKPKARQLPRSRFSTARCTAACPRSSS